MHEIFTGIEKKYFRSPSDLKTASLNRPNTCETPCTIFLNLFFFANLTFTTIITTQSVTKVTDSKMNNICNSSEYLNVPFLPLFKLIVTNVHSLKGGQAVESA